MTTRTIQDIPPSQQGSALAGHSIPPSQPERGRTPLQFHYLERVHTLNQMRRDMAAWPVQDPLPRKLIARALFAAYCACRDLGLEEEAREIMNAR